MVSRWTGGIAPASVAAMQRVMLNALRRKALDQGVVHRLCGRAVVHRLVAHEYIQRDATQFGPACSHPSRGSKR